MKLIIAGGRDYEFTINDIERLDRMLDAISITEVVSGGCPSGADACGESWARGKGLPVKRFLPDWDKNGKAAGPIRNKAMAKYADAVAIFPGGRGTASMRSEARKADTTVFDFTE